MSQFLTITDSFRLREDMLEERFVRSPGPGGQHVNKVSSAVQLKLNLGVLPGRVLHRLRALAPSQLSKDGFLRVEAHRFRERERNRAEARQKLQVLLRKAFERPEPRRKTRVPLRSVRRRLDNKRKRSNVKKGRSGRDFD